MTNTDDKQLHTLLAYLAAMIAVMVAVGWKTDKLPDVLAVLNTIVSGLFGAAMAILRQKTISSQDPPKQ